MIGARIKGLREEKTLTQAELGEALGFSKVTVYSWESGSRGVGAETLSDIADYFDTSADYLLGRTDDKRPVNKILADIKAAESTNKPVLFAPPQPTTLAAHQTNGDDSGVPQDRMDEIIIQAYNLIMSRRRDDT